MRRKLVFLGIALALAIPAASMAGGSDPAVQQSSGTITQQAAPTIRQTTVLSGSHAIARLAAYTLLPHHFVWLTAVCPISRPLPVSTSFQASSTTSSSPLNIRRGVRRMCGGRTPEAPVPR